MADRAVNRRLTVTNAQILADGRLLFSSLPMFCSITSRFYDYENVFTPIIAVLPGRLTLSPCKHADLWVSPAVQA